MLGNKFFLYDARGPKGWTTNDRARVADLCGVRGWTEPAIAGIPNLVLSGTSYYTYEGRPAGEPGTLIYRTADEAMRRGYDIFPTLPKQGRVLVWESPDQRQQTWGINLARREVAHWFARVHAECDAWAAGWHFDYWTSLGWLWDSPWYRQRTGTTGVMYPDQFWQNYDSGMGTFSTSLRAFRPTALQIGQQFHNGSPPYSQMRGLNGRWIEDYPTRWMSFDQNELQLKEWASQVSKQTPIAHVFELRDPTRFSITYQRQVLDWCAAIGAYCSWGVDATAMIGRP